MPVGSLNLCRYPEISLDNGAKSVDAAHRYPEISLDNGAKSVDAARYPEISLDNGDELEPMPLSGDISG